MNEEDKPAQSWACYIFGVVREITKRGGKVGGFDTAFSGDVPLWGGRSVFVGGSQALSRLH